MAREHGRQVVDVQEAVVEDDVVAEVEIARQPLERDPVLLAVVLGHLGMGLPGDQVERLRMARDDRRHGRDRHLDPLAGRDQAEGREHGAVGPDRVDCRPSRRLRRKRDGRAVGRPAAAPVGPPCGTTRTRSGDTSRASRIIRRAVSVKTHTSVARSQSARSVSAWRTDGADRTVCR